MRDDHEGPVDRAKRDAERDRSKEEEAAKARKKSESDARLKDERGKEVFERLRAWQLKTIEELGSELLDRWKKMRRYSRCGVCGRQRRRFC